jgi:hypothetical protein
MKANGEDVKVVQELVRHSTSNIATTMNLYAQPFSADARRAQARLVEMVRKAPIAVRELRFPQGNSPSSRESILEPRD